MLESWLLGYADSPLVFASKELASYAETSFTPGRPFLEACNDLLGRQEFSFILWLVLTIMSIGMPPATIPMVMMPSMAGLSKWPTDASDVE